MSEIRTGIISHRNRDVFGDFYWGRVQNTCAPPSDVCTASQSRVSGARGRTQKYLTSRPSVHDNRVKCPLVWFRTSVCVSLYVTGTPKLKVRGLRRPFQVPRSTVRGYGEVGTRPRWGGLRTRLRYSRRDTDTGEGETEVNGRVPYHTWKQ